jgi:hypothetical protein
MRKIDLVSHSDLSDGTARLRLWRDDDEDARWYAHRDKVASARGHQRGIPPRAGPGPDATGEGTGTDAFALMPRRDTTAPAPVAATSKPPPKKAVVKTMSASPEIAPPDQVSW